MKLSSLHVNEKLRQEKEVKNVFKQVFWLATMECRQFAVVLVFVVALLFFWYFSFTYLCVCATFPPSLSPAEEEVVIIN
jgi:hypothetical protein